MKFDEQIESVRESFFQLRLLAKVKPFLLLWPGKSYSFFHLFKTFFFYYVSDCLPDWSQEPRCEWSKLELRRWSRVSPSLHLQCSIVSPLQAVSKSSTPWLLWPNSSFQAGSRFRGDDASNDMRISRGSVTVTTPSAYKLILPTI